jgi:hypothetical protein
MLRFRGHCTELFCAFLLIMHLYVSHTHRTSPFSFRRPFLAC